MMLLQDLLIQACEKNGYRVWERNGRKYPGKGAMKQQEVIVPAVELENHRSNEE